jgi:hypothetical protein
MRPHHEHMPGPHGRIAAARGVRPTGDGDRSMNWHTLDLNLLVVFDPVAQERSATRAAVGPRLRA